MVWSNVVLFLNKSAPKRRRIMDKEEAKKVAKRMRDLLQKVLVGIRDGSVDEEKADQITRVVEDIMLSKTRSSPPLHPTTLPPTPRKPAAATGPTTRRVVHDPAADGIDTWGEMSRSDSDIPVTLPEPTPPPPTPPARKRITVEVAGGKKVAISSPPPAVAPATGVIDDAPDPRLRKPRQ
ncbi:MAG: hypothetical protein PHD72_02270 [Patescibacteria group bacterium]|nr:hypothetical protein [Patescibacteria group bacterium]